MGHAETKPRPPISVSGYLVLGALTMITPLATNMYVPALPDLASSFDSTVATAQLTVSAALIGIVLGQLVIGSISDRVGRRMPALLGTALFVITSVLCAFAPNMTWLIVMRVLEGFAGASGVVLARASIRDRVEGPLAAQALSRLLVVAAIGPIVGPFLGSIALHFTDWRGVFIALALAGAIAFVLSLRWFPETLHSRRNVDHAPSTGARPTNAAQTAEAWRRLVHDRTFWGYVVVAGLLGTVTFTWLSTGSFFMATLYGTTATGYALLVGFTSLCFLTGAWVNSRAVMRIGPRRALLRGLVLIGIGSLVLILTAVAHLPIGLTVVAVGITFLSYGGMIANAQALGMAPHGDAAGAASAFLGASQFLLGALIPPLITMAFGFTWAMPATMLAASAVAFVVTAALRRNHRRSTEKEPDRADDREDDGAELPPRRDPETTL